MGKTIKYKITFHTDWHCGAGLAAGADVDALTIKDRNGLPYVPGKTVKGLLREAADVLYGDGTEGYEDVFGRMEEKSGGLRSKAFFTNAVLSTEEREYILGNDAAGYLYRSLASTAIDDKGIAKDGSLRKIQVCVPCVLYGEIQEVDEKMLPVMQKALGYVKRMGQWRNRGLGRCTMEVLDMNDTKGGEQ